MTRLFGEFLDDVTALTGHAFQTVTITADGADLKAGGLARLSATWTYVVQDNPFGTDFGRAVQEISRLLDLQYSCQVSPELLMSRSPGAHVGSLRALTSGLSEEWTV